MNEDNVMVNDKELENLVATSNGNFLEALKFLRNHYETKITPSKTEDVKLIQYLVDTLGILDAFSERPNPADLSGEDAVLGRMVKALYYAKTKGYIPTK